MTPDEKPVSAIDNLERAKRMMLLDSADECMAQQSLRNLMIHKHIAEPVLSHNALQAIHASVAKPIAAAHKMIFGIENRGWAR